MASDYASPHFRAVNSRGVRRGLRLENIFWTAIEQISSRQGISVGGYFEKVEGEVTSEAGFSSRIRSAVVNDLVQRLDAIEVANSRERVFALVQASPGPTFLLSSDKKIVKYNPAFFSFIQSRSSESASVEMLRNMSLSLDIQIEDAILRLQATGGKPVNVGFALGVADRRVRGRLNLALASLSGASMLMAFVVP